MVAQGDGAVTPQVPPPANFALQGYNDNGNANRKVGGRKLQEVWYIHRVQAQDINWELQECNQNIGSHLIIIGRLLPVVQQQQLAKSGKSERNVLKL